MRLANPSLFSSYRWYEWFPLTTISQHPTMWRFLAYGYFRGTASVGVPSMTSWTVGYGVFDWDATTNRYELTWFDPTPDYWGYTPVYSDTAFTWVSDTVVRIVGSAGGGSTIDSVRYAGKFSVSTGGSFTWQQPTSTHCGNDLINYASFYNGWAVGYNGGVVYPYADGTFSEPYPTSNCYIGKITNTNSATNLGPLRSSGNARAQHAPLCSLGSSAAGNGFAIGVQNIYQDQTSNTVYTGLYNIAASTPAVTTTTTFSGRPNTFSPLHLGARKVVVPDYNDSTYNGKVSLLYTNSDTYPTSLTVGSSVLAPTLPFRATDVRYAMPVAGGFNCQNFWVGEGKGAGVTYYNLGTNLELGETNRYYYMPCKYISTGSSDLTISILSTDWQGVTPPFDTWWSSELQQINNYAFQFVGAPGNKAALFWKLGTGTSNTNQTIFQL